MSTQRQSVVRDYESSTPGFFSSTCAWSIPTPPPSVAHRQSKSPDHYDRGLRCASAGAGSCGLGLCSQRPITGAAPSIAYAPHAGARGAALLSPCCPSLQPLGFNMPKTIQFQHPWAGLNRRVCGYPAQSLSLFESGNDSGRLGFHQTRPLAQDSHELVLAAAPASSDVWPAVSYKGLRRFSEVNRIDHESLLY